MFRFFRILRRKLIEEDSFRKYLLYAIGEILLVVIGILIALQVNNLNEERKDRMFERNMLSEIQNALETQIETRSEDLKRYEKARNSIAYLIKVRNGEISQPDSLIWHIGQVDIRQFFVANSGPYEALKTSGLDKIRNDEIRRRLSVFYEEYLPATSLMINNISQRTILENVKLHDKLFIDGVKLNENGVLEDNYKTITAADLKTDGFLDFIRNSHAIQEQLTGFISATQGYAIELSGLIEHELTSYSE